MNKGVNMSSVSSKSVHFSSEKQTLETPQDFFDKVNSILILHWMLVLKIIQQR